MKEVFHYLQSLPPDKGQEALSKLIIGLVTAHGFTVIGAILIVLIAT